MTDHEAAMELERVVKEEFPLIASSYIDKEIMLREAQEISYKVNEWRGVNFPYLELHKDFMDLIATQYLTTSRNDIFYTIGEETVVTFLNDYYHWKLEDCERLDREFIKNPFELSNEDKNDFEEFKKIMPIPSGEPLDIAGYLHMCRIAYDAAPKSVYPDFVSDLYVVGSAKFNNCGLEHKSHREKMNIGEPYPWFMSYHPAEMGFGGPNVKFVWEDDCWIMMFYGSHYDKRYENMNILRFLAMRRAGYPIVYAV